LDDTDPLIDAA